jgi:hypothetical protein
MLGRDTREGLDIAPEEAAGRRRSRQKAALAGALGATVLAGVLAVVMGGRGPAKNIEVRSPGGVAAPDPPPGRSPLPSDSTIVNAGSRTGRAPAEIVALSGTEVVLLDSATGRQVRVLAAHPEADPATGVFLEGVSLSADRRSAYYAVAGECGMGTVYRVPVDGRGAPERVATGISPALSPDGSKLAFAAPGGSGPDGRSRCNNQIVVRELATGAERTWAFPEDADHRLALYQDGAITKIAWAPDSTRLAYTLSYEGDSVSILDTAVHHDLSETQEVVVPDGGGDSRQPAWQASSGRLAVVNSAFDCCYDDNYTGPPRALLVDPDLRLTENLLPPGKKPSWLDFDVTGDHLLYVDGGTLYRRSRSGVPAAVGTGYVAADW